MLNAVSWSLHVLLWVVTNVLDEIRFRFTESLHAVMQRQGQKTAAFSSKRRHDWVMKLNRKRVESNQEFQGMFGAFVSGKMWRLLYGKPW